MPGFALHASPWLHQLPSSFLCFACAATPVPWRCRHCHCNRHRTLTGALASTCPPFRIITPRVTLSNSTPATTQINWRLEDDPVTANTDPAHTDPEVRATTRTKIYLGYTSNLISAGVREQIRWLVQHRMVDVLVTTAGGIEEDFIKCMGHTYMGDFQLKGT